MWIRIWMWVLFKRVLGIVVGIVVVVWFEGVRCRASEIWDCSSCCCCCSQSRNMKHRKLTEERIGVTTCGSCTVEGT